MTAGLSGAVDRSGERMHLPVAGPEGEAGERDRQRQADVTDRPTERLRCRAVVEAVIERCSSLS